ncbi:MAG TPA: ClpXP protease specificity-enhancing factor SspB [Dongiaceae bacterium]|nr:ClpXP protease specificity-enhancing factor SspB [Dongiaceae bacterium]
MAKDWLRYDRLVEDALRSVVRRALLEVAANGLPGDHHFYLTFHTQDPGVSLSPALRAQYPKEMTIVLQHQFWGLEVTEDNFTVKLSFGGVRETLVIPFQSVVSFADPSVKFGLQFETAAEGEGEESDIEDGEIEDQSTPVPHASLPAKAKDLNDLPKSVAKDTGAPAADGDKPAGAKGAEVVALDAFRKK